MAASMLAILTAIEEVALGTIGTTEVVPVGTLVRGAYDPKQVGAPAQSFTHARVEVEADGPKDTGLVPRMSNVAALEYGFVIRCQFTTSFELVEDKRRAARATALETTELVRAAVTRAQNVLVTSGAVATQLVTGCLLKATTRVVSADFKRRLIVTEIAARGLVKTSRP